MQAKDRLQDKLDELNLRWKRRSNDIARLQESYDLETRVEEKNRQKNILLEQQQQLEQLEQEIQALETQLKQAETDSLISDAQLATKNKAYSKALELWQYILKITPTDQTAINEISQLQQQLQQQTQAKLLITQLINRMAEIPTVFAEVVKVLNSPNIGIETEIITEYTQKFINKEWVAEQYIEFCQTFLASPQKNSPVSDYITFAQRIKRGEMVLFIGSNLLQNAEQSASKESQLANILAEKIGYTTFNGTLSSIAELYQLLPEHGRISLLTQLHKALPSTGTRIKLYDSLAKISVPLVLISSAYDNLLEQAFIQAGKPYVELSSIIVRRDEYDIGHVVVRYSDNKHPERTYIAEDLSHLNVLKHGYSIIYKIRGTCKKDLQDSERDALTLSESNYFTFARYSKKIIPSYLSRQFRDRGFLFIGFTPKHWEDRLLVNILLKTRQYSSDACYTISSHLDKMEAAYWGSRNVRKYQANLQELEACLAEAVQ